MSSLFLCFLSVSTISIHKKRKCFTVTMITLKFIQDSYSGTIYTRYTKTMSVPANCDSCNLQDVSCCSVSVLWHVLRPISHRGDMLWCFSCEEQFVQLVRQRTLSTHLITACVFPFCCLTHSDSKKDIMNSVLQLMLFSWVCDCAPVFCSGPLVFLPSFGCKCK